MASNTRLTELKSPIAECARNSAVQVYKFIEDSDGMTRDLFDFPHMMAGFLSIDPSPAKPVEVDGTALKKLRDVGLNVSASLVDCIG